MDFHHKDPKEKDFNIGDFLRDKPFNKSAEKELDKCMLLCANCHREEHVRLNNSNKDKNKLENYLN